MIVTERCLFVVTIYLQIFIISYIQPITCRKFPLNLNQTNNKLSFVLRSKAVSNSKQKLGQSAVSNLALQNLVQDQNTISTGTPATDNLSSVNLYFNYGRLSLPAPPRTSPDTLIKRGAIYKVRGNWSYLSFLD